MRAAVLLLAALAACAPPPTPAPRYLVGAPYQLGSSWSYPREDFAAIEAGLAVVASDAPPRATANGEVWDDSGLFAAHRTLQLPAIIRVTNLENGLTLALRLNDRGPVERGRLLGVSPRAGALLGARPGQPFQARLEVLGEESRALAESLGGGGPGLAISAAPVGRVEREALAAPEGARALPARTTPGRAAPEDAEARATPPLRLPEAVVQSSATPGLLWLDGGSFFTPALARREAARIGGRAEPLGPRSRQQEWRVRAGPFFSVAEADQALARALAAGVAGARLLVE